MGRVRGGKRKKRGRRAKKEEMKVEEGTMRHRGGGGIKQIQNFVLFIFYPF